MQIYPLAYAVKHTHIHTGTAVLFTFFSQLSYHEEHEMEFNEYTQGKSYIY